MTSASTDKAQLGENLAKFNTQVNSKLKWLRDLYIKISDIYRATPQFQQYDDKARSKLMIRRLLRKAAYEFAGDVDAAVDHLQRKSDSAPVVKIGQAWSETDPKKPAWMTLAKAAYYMKFASAAYGTWFYVGDFYPAGPKQIISDYLGLLKYTKWNIERLVGLQKDAAVINDNILSLNSLIITLWTGVDPSDLIYVSYADRIAETVFYVTLDRKTSSIVVAVRGTCSQEDSITDCLGLPDDVTELQAKFPGAKAHQGMLGAARYVVNKLKTEKVLEKAFQKAPTFDLVVVGHSLGAGTAALVALLLHETYPKVISYVYEPPGWLVSDDLSKFARDFILSIVHGDDIVTRIGFYTLKKLSGTASQALKDIISKQKPEASAEVEYTGVRLYLPGRVLFLNKTQQGGAISKTLHEAVDAQPEQLQEIVVSNQNLHDHMEDYVQAALNEVASQAAKK